MKNNELDKWKEVNVRITKIKIMLGKLIYYFKKGELVCLKKKKLKMQ
ncbi:MAG: hypothetical protein RSE41_08370 [Clostridia bacterium]